MDKTNIVNTFTEVVDQLRNTECSQKEKIACFQRVAECIMSPVMAAHLNYATFCTKAVNILLLFCEDLDSVVRISAEENLNKIFRVLEKTKVSRILMDLYGEIKRNGNQRSLRICLRIFGYYSPQIREHNVQWYAQNLLPCMKVISKRKETLLQETLSEFVLKFGKYIQQGLTDSETCKLFEVFIENIGSDCAVKRRCTAQNCINLIEHACNKSLMAKYALNKVIDILLCDHQTNTIIGILGFLRQLVIIVIKGYSSDAYDNEDTFSLNKSTNFTNSEEARQMLEIYDYCLYLVSSTPLNQHSIINAALEVINSMLQCLEGISSRDKKNNPHLAPLLLQLMNDKNLKHVSYLRHKGTIKQQIFNLSCFEDDYQRTADKLQQASESVTKLFRPSSSSATKNAATPPANSSSSTTMDSISLVSNNSPRKSTTDTEIIDIIDESSPDTSKTFPTPSTAIMGEIRSLDSVDSSLSTKDGKQKVVVDKTEMPKRIVKNPFLNSPSSVQESGNVNQFNNNLNVDIGSLYEQTLIFYTARLITARFLLNGSPCGLYEDSIIRVSIKSICLNVIAQCVRLCPDILEITVKFMEFEKPKEQVFAQTLDISESNSPQITSDSSSNIGQDYEHLEAASGFNTESTRKSTFSHIDVFRMDDMEAPLLEIKDDHFGKSTTDFNFSQTTNKMSQSADPVLFTKTEERSKKSPILKTRKDLTTSEIIASDSKLIGFVEITKAEEDMPPEDLAPPKPPKRTKTIRKTKREAEIMLQNLNKNNTNVKQFIYEILFYYNHEDPILRAGVQTIIGHYCRSTQAGLGRNSNINLQYLLAILCMGLQDEIHTVVIQALNTFDKIFPYVIFKYMTTSTTSCSSSCHKDQHKKKETNKSNNNSNSSCSNNKQQQNSSKEEKSCGNACGINHRKVTGTDAANAATRNTNFKCISGHFNDNDEIIVALLNAFQLQTKFNNEDNNTATTTSNSNNSSDSNNINMTSGGFTCGRPVGEFDNSNQFPLSSIHHTSYCSNSTTFTSATLTRNHSYCSCCCCCCCYKLQSLLIISPKLLLNKLRLCHYNKYWLVQNKYAEVISNLNYASLRSYYGNNYTNNINNNNNNSSNNINHNRCSSICKCNCCCCCCSSLAGDVVSSSPSSKATNCHSCCGSGGYGNFLNGFVDDVDNADFVCNLENLFIDELLQLIGEDDVRVREHASKCLCNFILQNAKHTSLEQKKLSYVCNNIDKNVPNKTYKQNLNLLLNFLDYSILNDMSPALRSLLNPRHEQQTDILTSLDGSTVSSCSASAATSFNVDLPKREEIETVLAKVLYRLTNRLMSLKDKNMQFGIILCTKYLLTYFSFADYSCAWTEFNFMEIFVKLSQYNYNTAVDLTCQSDLIDVSSKLIVGSLIFQPDVHANRDTNLSLLKHTMKIINIYYHIFTNQKPLIMAKSQKVDLFSNAKELAITQSIGYFGNEHVYIKLYQTLKSAYDNYKITINEEAGSKLISLLKTCLNSMSSCIEMLPHEAAAIAYGVGGGSSSGGSSAGGGSNFAKNATDVNAVLFSNAIPAGGANIANTAATTTPGAAVAAMAASGTSATVCNSVLKLIEETLQYLTKVINYAPEESIACLRQLLKYLFARNYGNRQQQQYKQGYYPTIKTTTKTQRTFLKTYFKAKCKEQHCISKDDGTTIHKQQTNQPPSSSATSLSMFANVSKQQSSSSSSPTTIMPPIQLSTKDTSDYFSPSSASSCGVGEAAGFGCVDSQDDYLLLAELFASGLEFHTWKSEHESELSKHIKLFEPLVIYCITLFLKCNGRVQSQILDLLVLLLDFNITYSILDSKNVIFDNIIKSLEIIESGITRNGLCMITPIIKFLIKLSSKSEKILITIPKIISIINNLLANCNIRDVAVQALKTLSYEMFLMTSNISMQQHQQQLSNTASKDAQLRSLIGTQKNLLNDPNSLAAITENLLAPNNELDTQKEVILGMLEKFIESNDCQQVLSLLLLIEQLQQQYEQYKMLNDANKTIPTIVTPTGGGGYDSSGCYVDKQQQQQQSPQQQTYTTCLPNLDTVCNMICQSICSNRLYIQDWNDFYMMDTFFKNNTKFLLGNSKEFMSLLKYVIEGDVANFSDLSYATIILSNVILKTEEIYLVNHIKLYLKNHPTIAEKLRQKQQKFHDENPSDTISSSHSWLLDTKPTTSKAAAAAAQAQAIANVSNAINEIDYFATVLCNILLDSIHTILSDHHSTSPSWYSQQFAIQYCCLVCHFIKVLHQLCFNSRLEDSLLASIRFTLNACESKLLNEYYNLLMMYSTTQGCCPTSTVTAATTTITSTTSTIATTNITSITSLPEFDVDNSLLQLQLELYNLLNALGILDTLTLLQHLQLDDISNHVRRALLNKVCHQNVPNPIKWNQQQVQHLFNGKFLNILIIEQFAFVCYLCEVDEENCSLFQTMILKNIKVLNKHSIVYLLRLVKYLCQERTNCSRLCFARFLQILNKLYKLLACKTTLITSASPSLSSSFASSSANRPLQLQIERLARHLIVDASSMHDKNAIYDTFISLTEEEVTDDDEEYTEQQQRHNIDLTGITSSSPSSATSTSSYLSQQLQFIILNDLENSCEIRDDDINAPLGSVSNIVDEKWIFNQLIKFSAQNNYDPQQIVKILLEIQSENKLQKIFNNSNFDATRILRHSIASSLQAMLQTFRNNCIQYNPHIHYMQPNPLARVALTQLMTRIVEMMRRQQQQHQQQKQQKQAFQFEGRNSSNDDDDSDAKQRREGDEGVEQQTNSNNNTDNNKQQATVVKDYSGVDRNNAIGVDGIGIGNVIGVGGDDGTTNNDSILLPITADTINTTIHLCEAVIALMENIKQIEVTALIYIESKFIDKFLSEHLLRPEHVITLVRFMGCCCQYIKIILNRPPSMLMSLTHEERNCITVSLQCIDILLHQKFIWYALNQQQHQQQQQQQQTLGKTMPTTTKTTLNLSTTGAVGCGGSNITDSIDSCLPLTKCELNKIICLLLDVVVLSGSLLLENTIFYRKYKNALRSSTKCTNKQKPYQQQQQQQPDHEPEHEQHKIVEETFENIKWLTAEYNPKVIFLGKLIETKIGNNDKGICFGGGEYSASSFSGAATTTSSGLSVTTLSYNDVLDLKGINNQFDFISLHTLLSISISSLRFNLFYALAVTPYEIIQQQQRLLACQSTTTSPTTSPSHKSQSATSAGASTSTSMAGTTTTTITNNSNSMLPIIPIESLSDVDILKSFVKRLSIFGFTTRQQFEEYFMTFLLLINKVYDENMVDQQEQFQIRSICLEAIMELLITYKTFPIVGNKLSLYHHTTRWNRINCDTISLKKLHEIQLIISPSNVFYHSNLERNLICDSVIGTQYFAANQFDLNFIWQQMENSSASSSSNSSSPNSDESDSLSLAGGDESSMKTSSSAATKHLFGVAANTAFRNYQYFTKQSGVDYKSSSQLIFDVLMQMIEQNHILILPNLVKFTEICENREQIKQIWEKADYLKSHIPMDDTISHQHLIYLLCKTKSMLIPSHMEMLNLESLIKNYLKSSHLFIRCAALNGLLSLLESYAKTSTTIGKLSDELVRLKDIVLGYIDKHGLIEASPLLCSDIHTKLIWTLNYCLMEWTSKLDPQCNLAYHTKLSVTKLLKNSTNEQVYLCCLHGLERMIVLDNKVSSSSNNTTGSGVITHNPSADNQNQMLRPCIEKLALELAKLENEKFSIPALKLLLSCIYVGSRKQLENTELSNGIVQDDPEIIAQQTDKVDILLQCIKTANEEAAWIYGQVLCQMIRDLVPPKEILTKVIKEFLAINQPHSDVIAMIVFQVFRSAIDSSFLQQLQDWLTCSLPTFLALPEHKAVWSLSVVFLSASINLHLMKLFPLLLSGIKTAATTTTTRTQVTPTTIRTPATTSVAVANTRMSCEKLGHHEIALFVTSAQDFYAKLGNEQKLRFRDAFKEFHHIKVYNKMLQSL
ncbi:huntingtin isoform 3-T3 [Cochliomyia hominivorax]